MGLVQIEPFWGNRTDDLHALSCKVQVDHLERARSDAGQELVAEHLEPMRVRLASQELRWRFPHTARAIASLQSSVVQVELQQGQIIRAQMATEEEVASQAAIEVLDQRT